MDLQAAAIFHDVEIDVAIKKTEPGRCTLTKSIRTTGMEEDQKMRRNATDLCTLT